MPHPPTLRALPVLTALILAAACSRDEITIARGTPIHHDDFDYLVTSVEKVERIGDRLPRGEFYVVGFTVENHAKRVEHAWTNDVAFVVDQSAAVFNNDVDAQQRLAAARHLPFRERHVTPAGATESTLFVFDVPKNAAGPALKVRGEFLMGDLFDGNRYARTKIRLN